MLMPEGQFFQIVFHFCFMSMMVIIAPKGNNPLLKNALATAEGRKWERFYYLVPLLMQIYMCYNYPTF